ncbi:hypothetical protein [Bifidobacterium dolichotidis]|uniref:hypothetical protein n=1 Tax=Bifidobacterium dolichotidis TaxID=2306976 RepID=UPI0013DE22BA|nr:hypothetical protein [Bifidobacterium dolichotidis]
MAKIGSVKINDITGHNTMAKMNELLNIPRYAITAPAYRHGKNHRYGRTAQIVLHSMLYSTVQHGVAQET